MIATLTLLDGDLHSRRWALRPHEVFRIGRADDNHAKPEARGLSRHHTEIVFQRGEWFARDLGSTNGTWVGGVHIPPRSEAPLKPNVKVQAGSAEFLFRMWEPLMHICPLCGEGEIFDEEALVQPPFARQGVLLCVNCGGALRYGPGGKEFDFVFVPGHFAENRARMGEGPFALQDIMMFGEAVLDELEKEHYQQQGAAPPQAHQPPAEAEPIGPRPAQPPKTAAAPTGRANAGAKANGQKAPPKKPDPPRAAPRPPAPASGAKAPPPKQAPPLAKKAPAQTAAKPPVNGAKKTQAKPAPNSAKSAQPQPPSPPPPTRQIVLPGLRIGSKSSAAQALEVLERAKGQEAGKKG